MPELGEFIDPATVIAGMHVGSRKSLFHQLAAMAEANYALNARMVAERLLDREHQGSTGYGGGVAMPHCRFAELNRVVGLFAQLSKPIDFGAVDELPVDLVFVLLSPEDAGVRHLKALARVSRALRDQEVQARLRGAGSSDALYAMLVGIDARDAA